MLPDIHSHLIVTQIAQAAAVLMLVVLHLQRTGRLLRAVLLTDEGAGPIRGPLGEPTGLHNVHDRLGCTGTLLQMPRVLRGDGKWVL